MIPQEIKDSLTNFFCEQDSSSFLILSESALSGGCINEVVRLETNRGDFCLKYNRSQAYPGMFESEAKGLRLLQSAGEIRIPDVIHAASGERYAYLLLEFVKPGKPVTKMMEDFGHSLARLHRHTAAYFGNDHDNYMGSLHQSNSRHADWGSFFRGERLEKQVQLARTSGYFSKKMLDCFSRLYREIETNFPKEQPSLVHGDLWGGNYLVAENGKACLVDPAVYYGQREVDIAMTTLFGGFSQVFYDAYDEEYPLSAGWRERLDICNLYPLLIHLNLFGSGYLGQIESIVSKF